MKRLQELPAAAVLKPLLLLYCKDPQAAGTPDSSPAPNPKSLIHLAGCVLCHAR